MRSSEQTTYSRVLLHSHQYTLNILSKLLYNALFNSFEFVSYCIVTQRIQMKRFELVLKGVSRQNAPTNQSPSFVRENADSQWELGLSGGCFFPHLDPTLSNDRWER